MELLFAKYQGTGNDFILVDNRQRFFPKEDKVLINKLCDRKFGIGADGLILLEQSKNADFEMIYFNADGNLGSMCGNGGRCITAFAEKIGIHQSTYNFMAFDGPHQARINDKGWVELHMKDVADIEVGEDYFIIDTGSPHYIIFVEDIDDINVVENGQAIRYSNRFRKEGINVNFVEQTKTGLLVATYERGVEDETLSCGTGVTAAAIAYHLLKSKKDKVGNNEGEIKIEAKGGQLKVKLATENQSFNNIWLIGPATLVFEGKMKI